jgi:predicted  nucleic acid-binding Zn-ribbon protein
VGPPPARPEHYERLIAEAEAAQADVKRRRTTVPRGSEEYRALTDEVRVLSKRLHGWRNALEHSRSYWRVRQQGGGIGQAPQRPDYHVQRIADLERQRAEVRARRDALPRGSAEWQAAVKALRLLNSKAFRARENLARSEEYWRARGRVAQHAEQRQAARARLAVVPRKVPTHCPRCGQRLWWDGEDWFCYAGCTRVFVRVNEGVRNGVAYV